MINLVECFGQVYGTKIRCAASFGKVFYNIANEMNGKATSKSLLNPNWLSVVSKKDPKQSKIQYSKTFDKIGPIAIPLKSSQVKGLL